MHIYGLIIGIAIVIGLNYFQKHSQLKYFPYFLLFFAIIGARLYHVLDFWSYYSQNLWQIPATWNGGLGIYGAIIASTIYVSAYSYFKKLSVIKILDSITPILPLCQSIGRLGNFFNHEIPTWWIESLANLALFFIIKKFPKNPTAKYFIGYGTIRFFVEFLRSDTWHIYQISIAQIISVIMILIGLWIIKLNKTISVRH